MSISLWVNASPASPGWTGDGEKREERRLSSLENLIEQNLHNCHDLTPEAGDDFYHMVPIPTTPHTSSSSFGDDVRKVSLPTQSNKPLKVPLPHWRYQTSSIDQEKISPHVQMWPQWDFIFELTVHWLQWYLGLVNKVTGHSYDDWWEVPTFSVIISILAAFKSDTKHPAESRLASLFVTIRAFHSFW